MSDAPQLIDDFTPHEVSLAEDIVACAGMPITASNCRRVLMLILRGHFSNTENYGPEFYDRLKCYYWTPTDSRMRVGFYPSLDDDRPDDYPAVLVGYGGVELKKLVMGDVFKMSADTATTYLVKGANLSLNVRFTAKDPDEAWDMADMSAGVLTAIAAPVVSNMGADLFEVVNYGAPSKETPSPDRYYTVAMNVRIGYNRLVSRSVESHRLRRIVSLRDIDTQPQPPQQCH